MTSTRSKFSERLFEFLFNAEYISKNAAQIAGMPDIPSQAEEEWLGYDVAFDIQNNVGDVVGALALQHKVTKLVDGPGSTANIDFRKTAGNPYLVFSIDPYQFNTIESIVAEKLPGLEFYYCAPLFVDRLNLNGRYAAKDLDAHSVYIDIDGVGRLDESIPHSIVYTPAGNQAWVFSNQPKPLKITLSSARKRAVDIRLNLSFEQVSHAYKRVFSLISEGYEHRIKRETEKRGTEDMDKLQELMQFVQNLKGGRPKFVDIENEGQAWREIAFLFARFLSASTIVEKIPAHEPN